MSLEACDRTLREFFDKDTDTLELGGKMLVCVTERDYTPTQRVEAATWVTSVIAVLNLERCRAAESIGVFLRGGVSGG